VASAVSSEMSMLMTNFQVSLFFMVDNGLFDYSYLWGSPEGLLWEVQKFGSTEVQSLQLLVTVTSKRHLTGLPDF
jgi:hypothetical protein